LLLQKLKILFTPVLQSFVFAKAENSIHTSFKIICTNPPYLDKMKGVAFALCLALLLNLIIQKGNCSSSCDLSTLPSNASSVMCEQQSDLEMIEFMEDVLRSIAGNSSRLAKLVFPDK